jgi:predicted TIM-barrel fold metal-dependent hydrolase
MARPNYRVIDADGHVDEKAVNWAELVPERYRRDAPCWVTFPDGRKHLVVEGKLWPSRRDFYGQLGMWPEPRKPQHMWGWDREGMQDPHKRIPDMDLEGIDVAVLFGTFVGLGAASCIEDPGLALAVCIAYNNWLDNYCKPYPDRLKGIALIPMQDPHTARTEMRRAVEKLGMVGVQVLTNFGGRLLHEPQFDPIWEEAQGLGVPICVHIISTNSAGIDRFDRYVFKHAFYPLDSMLAAASFVSGGILERYPKLKVAFMEAGVGWVPWLMDRLHEHYELLPQQMPWQQRDPEEWIKSENCFFAVEPEERTIPFVAQMIGEERLIYASDYSHWDCLCPDSVKLLNERTDLSEGLKRKIFGENAARLFNV